MEQYRTNQRLFLIISDTFLVYVKIRKITSILVSFLFLHCWLSKESSTGNDLLPTPVNRDVSNESEYSKPQSLPISRSNFVSSNLTSIKSDKGCRTDLGADTDKQSSLNDARALRIMELINDYRSLLIHTMEQFRGIISLDNTREYCHRGHRVLRQNHAAARQLLASSYKPAAVFDYKDDDQAIQLRR